MKFDILNRFSGRVQFTAEIDAIENTLLSIKLGLAVKAAIKEGANLRGANLRGANLEDANLEANIIGHSKSNRTFGTTQTTNKGL